MWLTWGPSGADRTQVGPMLAPWNFYNPTYWVTDIACLTTKCPFLSVPAPFDICISNELWTKFCQFADFDSNTFVWKYYFTRRALTRAVFWLYFAFWNSSIVLMRWIIVWKCVYQRRQYIPIIHTKALFPTGNGSMLCVCIAYINVWLQQRSELYMYSMSTKIIKSS